MSDTEPKVKSPSKNEHGLNAQREAFAQAVASGKTLADAFLLAYPGVSTKPATLHPQASKLAADPRVAARIKMLRAAITERAIEDAVVDKDYVMRRLKTVAERCMQVAPVLDRKGNPVLVETPDGEEVPAFTFNSMGANRALELLGKEIGLFVERKETGKPGDFANTDKEALRKSIRERGVKLGLVKVQKAA